MARIAVSGNCQAVGVEKICRVLSPSSYVKTLLTWEPKNWYNDPSALAADRGGFDLIFSQ